ncbi:MAG: DsrH/TusB family sulfur metabolism protein [Thermodesulfovibrionales bacterium]|nr:DsrH/TusB family sulfur metabolism protein [Thermodesulfovibrionales bacterium]
MLVIVKSGPDTVDGKRGVKLARDMAADLFLMQNGVYFVQKERLEDFCGTAYVLEDDRRLRGIRDDELGKGVKRADYDSFVDLMTENDKVAGMF